jgi:hypothetical protein
MTHLTMEQLLNVREPASSPGSYSAQQHLETCQVCQAELERLHQRTAQLKALPMLRPPRDAWLEVRSQVVGYRRRRRAVWGGAGGLALAASIAMFLVLGDRNVAAAEEESSRAIGTAMAQSQMLETALGHFQPERRVTDGRRATVVAGLENQIAEVDRQLQVAGMMQQRVRDEALLDLWRQRVGLMDALVNVHLTRATNAGL